MNHPDIIRKKYILALKQAAAGNIEPLIAFAVTSLLQCYADKK